MIPFNRILLAGGTIASAVGIGFVMQHSGPTAPENAPVQTAMSEQSVSGVALAVASPANRAAMRSVAEPVSDTDVTLELNSIELTTADITADRGLARRQDESVQLAALDKDADRLTAQSSQPMASCDPSMAITPAAIAMVDIAITSCAPESRVTLHHNGLMASYITDANGGLNVLLPALSEQAVFIAAFPDGTGAVGSTTVADMGAYERVAVQWSGDAGFQLHAREFGAGYGDAGHIWAGATGGMARAADGSGGVLTRLGDFDLPDSLRAEIYTFPTGTASRDGDVALSVEAELTEANCGREIEAQSMQLQDGGVLGIQDLTLQVPDCDGEGGFLVLKNLLQDLKIARN